ncbi:TadE/TadG family type IV pilus assembly protein [Tropicimonas sp. S265A]|uniref:TadE/TadG family type IV pilus assembly protein n=1 Tax=Tropicimonas sp. S265A TaxID=3415134 RepID=UPI003C7C7B7F
MYRFRLKPLFRRFAREEKGAVIAEFLFAMCWLCWWYVAAFAFFDGFRQYNASIKATYTVGDILSRQMFPVDSNYLEGLKGLYEYSIKFGSLPELRYSSIRWVDNPGQYEVHWSYATGSKPTLTNADMLEMQAKLPILTDNEHVILVESSSIYQTLFTVGVREGLEFNNFMVTSPRFSPRLEYELSDGTLAGS